MNSRASKDLAYLALKKPKFATGLLSIADKVRLSMGRKPKSATSTPLYKKRTTIAEGIRNFAARMKGGKIRPFSLKGTY